MSIDVATFRSIMRRYATGVMVLTTPAQEGMHAITVNAVTSVSLNPTLMLVCIEKNAQSHALVHASGVYVLHILSDAQVELGQRFAFDREARSHPADFAKGHIGQTGGLIFDDAPGYLECRVVEEYPGGDHTIFIGEVVAGGIWDIEGYPLLYYQSHFEPLK